mgnify:CR=1 FL=1
MGAIWRARDRTTGDRVALKVLHFSTEKNRVRFLREAHTLAGLEHEGIVRYIEHGTIDESTPFLVMEWLEGVPLSRIFKQGVLSLEQARRLGVSVCRTLAWAHDRGVVHRDLKPSNLLVLDDDFARVKLLDFGIARAGGMPALTGAETMLGTPGYMAPEQARGDPNLDGRADLFSLGCVLYKVITGRAVFAGSDALAILAKVCFEPAPRLRTIKPDVPEALDALIMRLLKKEPADRPTSAASVAEALLAMRFAAQLGVPRPSVSAPAISDRERRLISVVACKMPTDPDESDGLAMWSARLPQLHALVEPFGARLELLATGSAVAALWGRGSATDQAMLSARCALALRSAVPGAIVAIATGSGELSGHLPVGDVIETAAELLRRDATSGVRVDETTASLLESRFVMTVGTDGPVLVSERRISDAPAGSSLHHALSFVGRDRELERISEALASAAAGGSSCAVIVGAAGVGKTRLVSESLRGRRDLTVIAGRGDPLRKRSALAPFKQALRSLFGVRTRDTHEAIKAKIDRGLASRMNEPTLTRTTAFLLELLGSPLEIADERLRAARRDASIMYDQTARAITDVLIVESAARPTVLWLEDLHHIDSTSVVLISEVLRRVRSLCVLVTARPEALLDFPIFARHASQVELSPLDEDWCGVLVRSALGDDVPSEVIKRVTARSEGKPRYLEEFIWAEMDGKGADTPHAVVAMTHTRLEHLSPETRRILRAGSVLGDRFTKDELVALLGTESSEELTGGLLELVRNDWIDEEREVESVRYAFRHDVVRDVAYAMLTDDDRGSAHRAAAVWLEANSADDVALVGEHWFRGGEEGRASSWFARACRDALNRNDFDGCLAWGERALACGASDEIAAEIRRRQAEVHNARGAHALAEVAAREALARATGSSEDYFRAGGELIVSLSRQAKVDEISSTASALLACPIDTDTAGALAIALSFACSTLAFVRRPEAERILAEIDVVVTRYEQGEVLVLARLDEARANLAIAKGDLDAYVAIMLSVADSFEIAGAEKSACFAAVNLGYVSIQLGRPEEGVRTLEAALARAKDFGFGYAELAATHNLGLALARVGRLLEGMAMERAAIVLAKERGDTRVVGASRAYLARMLLDRGDAQAAEAEARAAVHVLKTTGSSTLAMAHSIHALTLMALGRSQDALVASRCAVAAHEANDDRAEYDSLVRLAHARALHATGDVEAATRVLSEARAFLQTSADKISDAIARRHFLVDVADNRAVWEPA